MGAAMSDKSKIEWLDGGSTWPVIRGCTKCSPGCDNCWAIADAHLHAGSPNAKARAHFAGLIQIQNGRPNWTGEVRLDESILELPLHWKKPRKVFVASSGDLFHESLSDESQAAVLDVMERAPHHTYMILTKRAERMHDQMARLFAARDFWKCPPDSLPKNWWVGVSVEDDERARLRLPWLLKIQAAVRWVSYEPALGPVNWLPWLHYELRQRIQWVVIGGESGRGARPFDLAWARDTIAQCRAANVPVFMKQFGARPYDGLEFGTGHPLKGGDRKRWIQLKSRKGSDPSEWEPGLCVREWPRERGEGGWA
jgi:protein gp37